MRHRRTVCALACMAVALSGCQGDNAPAASEPSLGKERSDPPAAEDDRSPGYATEYVTFVRSYMPELSTGQSQDLLDAGRHACRQFEAGRNDLDLLHGEIDRKGALTETELEVFTAVLVGAVTYLCPQHEGKLTD